MAARVLSEAIKNRSGGSREKKKMTCLNRCGFQVCSSLSSAFGAGTASGMRSNPGEARNLVRILRCKTSASRVLKDGAY